MAAMLVTLLSFANEKTLFKIENDADKISVTVDVKEGNQLLIKNNNGLVLYKEAIKQSGLYTKSFDLTELPNGSYIFELEKDVEIQTIPFTVAENTVSFKKDMETVIFKPVTRVKGNMVFVSRLSLNKAPMEIAIYFTAYGDSLNSEELVYSETITNTEKANRIYKLASKKDGDYKIVFKTEDRTFTTQID